MSENNPLSHMEKQLRMTDEQIKEANLKRVRSTAIRIINALENLSRVRAKDIPMGISENIKTVMPNIKGMSYPEIREIVNQEVRSRSEHMEPVQREAFKKLWKILADELFGKETPEEEKPLTKSEKQGGFINLIATEWARRIFDHYENPEQLNFGALLASMEREFGTMPSLPGQLERAESSKPITSALDELKKRIGKELEAITNPSQLEAIKNEGIIKKLEDAIELYKRAMKGGEMN